MFLFSVRCAKDKWAMPQTMSNLVNFSNQGQVTLRIIAYYGPILNLIEILDNIVLIISLWKHPMIKYFL